MSLLFKRAPVQNRLAINVALLVDSSEVGSIFLMHGHGQSKYHKLLKIEIRGSEVKACL